MNRIIGLTGGIGAGKSTVARMLAAKGAVVIDADRVAHDVYEPGAEGFDLVVRRFGSDIVGGDGRIDRKALGAKVFGDSNALRDLNAIIHPLVRKDVARRLLDAARSRPDAVVVIEAALMTETGWTGGAGTLWVVIADPETAVRRLARDRAMSEAEARLRISAQATNEARRGHADVVIENDGTLDELQAAVDDAWASLTPAQ
jgi:dephospho-CoA kinase